MPILIVKKYTYTNLNHFKQFHINKVYRNILINGTCMYFQWQTSIVSSINRSELLGCVVEHGRQQRSSGWLFVNKKTHNRLRSPIYIYMSHVTAYGNNSIYLNRSKSQIHRKPKHIKHVGMPNVYNIPIFIKSEWTSNIAQQFVNMPID